jgi:hypothetical protein
VCNVLHGNVPLVIGGKWFNVKFQCEGLVASLINIRCDRV